MTAKISDDEIARLTVWVRGHVQGVGFRLWASSLARDLGLDGYAENLPDGRVKVVAEGRRASCLRLLELLTGAGSPGRVAGVDHEWSLPNGNLGVFSER